ncbi:Leucine-rich repeat-containing protein 40 [Phytophthora citrophthora]|uniref:Leucine-rich repeat-containing protein 40 n=1 Tax=Phytophthora citrophthora TaxID=4793 RepID=A0AAD9LEE7_9STRA|nr:Leucine-rich repeat-containing protein 40 [Phytophthora citrophthora]
MSLRDAMRRSAASSSSAAQGSAMARTLRLARQSGSLNLSSREFHAFPGEVFRLYDDLDEDEHSWECAVLKKLDLSYNEIAELPSQVETLKYLMSFKMRHNHLRQLPLTLCSLESLTTLDLSNNELEGCLPDQLGRLDKLRELGLEGNKLTQLPESIGGLVHLEVLRVDSNQLKSLPSTIGNLRNLKTLSAHSNDISELPVSFSSLTGLFTLDLKKNSLVTTGTAFIQLTSIKYIDLRQNKLEMFPRLPENNTCLDQLFLGFNLLRDIPVGVLSVKESLTVLDVRDNKLQRLSDRIPQLYRLKTLDVTNNDLHDLPPGFGYLKYLDHLLVEGNPLKSIRRSIISAGTEPLKKYLRTRGSPPKGVDAMEEEVDEFAIRQREMEQDEPMAEEPPLEDEYLFRDAAVSGNLQLVDMKLHQLPEQLHPAGKYRFRDTLLQLNLSKNWLVDLPAAIGELSSLHTLIAEQCGLKSIHASIAMIPRLEHLRLSKNSLTTDAINAMLESGTHASVCFTLKELDLRNNVLTDVPQNLQHLEMMDTLLLSFNRIRALDNFQWSSMRQLSVLSIADNRLESCGTVHEIPKLTSLSLENNELRQTIWDLIQIPAQLALCEHLRALYLAGNPQRGIRTHILNNGTEAVLKYLRNRLPPDVLPPTIGSKVMQSPLVKDTTLSSQDNGRAIGKSSAGQTLESKRLRVDASTSPFKPHEVTPANANSDALASPFAKQPPPAPTPAQPPTTIPVEDEVLVELNATILKLEQQLDDFAISAAKRFALKKDLAMARSKKIRHLRAIGQKP